MNKSPLGIIALLFLVAALYAPLKHDLVPLIKEAWFQMITKSLVQKNPPVPDEGTIWLGATRPELPQSLYGIYELQQETQRQIQLVSFYQAWGDGPEHEFPYVALKNMHQGAFIPMITWEPWLSAFRLHQGKEPKNPLRIIAQGSVDSYIRKWARGAVTHGKPIFVRIAHEPTNPQYPWAPQYDNTVADYQKFWEHVVQIFRDEGALNVRFIWTPFGLEDHSYYPGNQWVDWIGLDLFNYGGLSIQGTWLDFYSLAKLYIDAYKTLAKPIMAAEVASSSSGGNKSDWYRDLLRNICRGELPELKAIVLFDIASGNTASGLPVDWSLAEFPGTASHFSTQTCSILKRYNHE